LDKSYLIEKKKHRAVARCETGFWNLRQSADGHPATSFTVPKISGSDYVTCVISPPDTNNVECIVQCGA